MMDIINLDKLTLFIGIFLAVCILVIAAIMLDLWDGVHTARVTGVSVHSHKLRVTIKKMSEYFRFIVIGFLVDCLGLFFGFYLMPFVVLLFGLGLISVEAKSMFEHARRRKSHATDLPDIIKSIVACAHEKKARQIIELVGMMNNDNTIHKDENKRTTQE
ncbi:MAG: phage holin family protein [Muribaculaceae bacterium]|nr:phage holin family protein [Muribaculaceae bacterium]